MIVRVRLFAQMAQQAGDSSFALELPAGATPAALRSVLETKYPRVRWPGGTLVAVNQEYVAADRVLKSNDEVAIIPPVSGG